MEAQATIWRLEKDQKFFFFLCSLPVRSPWVGWVPGLKATSPVKQPSAHRFPLAASETFSVPWPFSHSLSLQYPTSPRWFPYSAHTHGPFIKLFFWDFFPARNITDTYHNQCIISSTACVVIFQYFFAFFNEALVCNF